MSRSRLIRGGVWLTAGNALSAGASFLRNIAIARLVSVEDFGIVVLLSMTLSIVETVSNIAIDRLLIQAPDGDDAELQAAAHVLQVLRGVLGGAVVYFVAASVAVLFKVPQATWAFQVLALVLAIRSFSHLDTVRFQREMHYKPTFWGDALPQAVSLAIAVPLAYWLRDYSAIVWTMLVQAMVQVLITHVLASRPYRWAWQPKMMRRILSFGWPLLANGLLMFAIFQGDKALIAIAFSPEVVGWYGAAFMLTMAPATLLTSVIQSLLLPVLARCQTRPDDFKIRYLQVVQLCLAIGLLTAVGFSVFGPELLIVLFGASYREGAEIVILLGLTQGIRIAKAGQFVSSVALTRTKDPLISNLARGGSLLIAIGFVMEGYGPVMIAVAGLLGEILAYVVAMLLLSRHLKMPVFQQMPHMLTWLLLAGISWLIGAELHGSSLSLTQFIIGFAWFFFATSFFVAVAPAIRSGVIEMFRKN
jgi:O-antigen/teichoic acid export membrane protein